MTIHAADRLLKKETSITAARDEAKLNLENALKVQTDSTAEIKEARDALADEELILTNLTSLQERSVALQKEQIQNKINAVGVGTGTTVADKNAKLDLKNTAALTA
jgi:hypothetical protein